MNTLGKILGISLLGVSIAGCAPSLRTAEPKLGKYDTNINTELSEGEARLLLENEFDVKPKDGKFSDEETLDAINYAGTIPDNSDDGCYNFKNARRTLLDTILYLREQKEAEEKK